MRISIVFSLTFLLLSPLFGQYSEVGIQLGLSNYMGDLSDQKMKTDGYGSLIGIFGRYNFTSRISAKASISKGSIMGDDKSSKNALLRERNLNFRSDLLELAFTGEYNLSPFNIRAKQTSVPYVFAGIALTHFNPQAQMMGSWYDLQPLETEGVKYNRYVVAVPFGLGFKFNISYKVNFSFELGARKTFTDYLDDVSTDYLDVIALRGTAPIRAALAYRTPELTGSFGENPVGKKRGDSSNKDWYFFGGLIVSVNLTDKYGLDFDKKYEIFKNPITQPEHEKEPAYKKPKKNGKNFKLFKKKTYMGQPVRKRVEKGFTPPPSKD